MRSLALAVLLFGALVLAPAVATLPTADACQPYSFRCPTGHYVHGCGTMPPLVVFCALYLLDGLEP